MKVYMSYLKKSLIRLIFGKNVPNYIKLFVKAIIFAENMDDELTRALGELCFKQKRHL